MYLNKQMLSPLNIPICFHVFNSNRLMLEYLLHTHTHKNICSQEVARVTRHRQTGNCTRIQSVYCNISNTSSVFTFPVVQSIGLYTRKAIYVKLYLIKQSKYDVLQKLQYTYGQSQIAEIFVYITMLCLKIQTSQHPDS